MALACGRFDAQVAAFSGAFERIAVHNCLDRKEGTWDVTERVVEFRRLCLTSGRHMTYLNQRCMSHRRNHCRALPQGAAEGAVLEGCAGGVGECHYGLVWQVVWRRERIAGNVKRCGELDPRRNLAVVSERVGGSGRDRRCDR